MTPETAMRFAYADPPYLGCCALYGHEHGDDGRCWDRLSTHVALIERLTADFDGWALSLSASSLQALLPLCPTSTHPAVWVKPFAVFKPNVNPAWTWEPVLVHGARAHRDRTEPTVRDHLSEPITLRRGLTGAKPEAFCAWVLDLLGYRPGIDTLIDLYPGTGVMDRVLARRGGDLASCGEPITLFDGAVS